MAQAGCGVRWRRGACALVALALVAGCGRGTASRRPVNVVVFLIDTLRADRLGVYGYPLPTSPAIDALAKESVVFEDASAAAPWTLPSVCSLMLSTFLPEHGVVRDGQRIPAELPTLATRLKGLGLATASYYGNAYAGPFSGLDRGFDVCEQEEMEVGGEQVARWLAQKPPGRFFLYLHNVGPHDPYDPPPEALVPFGEVKPEARHEVEQEIGRLRDLARANLAVALGAKVADNSPQQTEVLERLLTRRADVEKLYDGEVREADRCLGDAVKELRDAKLWDDTLFVLVADHGEELGDHGGFEHDQSLYQELVHVPLIVHFPGGAHAGERVSAPVSLVDLAPTILAALGAPDSAAEGCRGKSLLPLVAGARQEEPRAVSFRKNEKKYYRPWADARGQENVVVRDGAWKAIWDVEPDRLELYDLANDPGETHDLAADEPARVARLLDVARARRDRLRAAGQALAPATEGELTPEQRANLRALGYGGGKDE